jgi:hypothetical protein
MSSKEDGRLGPRAWLWVIGAMVFAPPFLLYHLLQGEAVKALVAAVIALAGFLLSGGLVTAGIIETTARPRAGSRHERAIWSAL